jgi:hypothetical protein
MQQVCHAEKGSYLPRGPHNDCMPSVKFTVLSVAEAGLPPDYKVPFLTTIGQIVKWEFGDASGAYSGLMAIEGETPITPGFQAIANISASTEGKAVSLEQFQELSRIVNAEFLKRAVVSCDVGSAEEQRTPKTFKKLRRLLLWLKPGWIRSERH